jgi:succinate-acetate transporter protein
VIFEMAVEHVLLIAIPFLIMAIGLYFKDPPIVAFAGFITMIVGIFVMINGVGDIVDPLIRYGIGVILLGIGGYVGVRAGYEQFKND